MQNLNRSLFLQPRNQNQGSIINFYQILWNDQLRTSETSNFFQALVPQYCMVCLFPYSLHFHLIPLHLSSLPFTFVHIRGPGIVIVQFYCAFINCSFIFFKSALTLSQIWLFFLVMPLLLTNLITWSVKWLLSCLMACPNQSNRPFRSFSWVGAIPMTVLIRLGYG